MFSWSIHVAGCVIAFLPLLKPSCAEILPPVLPVQFLGQFTEYYAPLAPSPPYENGLPPAPLTATRGNVFYDWTLKNMIEERLDYCVNIFPFGNDFPCTFQNVNGTSYLITFNKTADLPPCCVFGQPWYPPEPDFLRKNVTAVLKGEVEWSCKKSNWWEVSGIAPPTGPFWYAFQSDVDPSVPQVYQSFSFPGMKGWVQQDFFNIALKAPPTSVWDLPRGCLPIETLPNCGFFFKRPQGKNF